jgi:hypothetical protein
MSSLGGSTAAGLAAGSSAGGATAGASGPTPNGGASAPQPNGAATALGRLLVGPMSAHAHTDADTGGVLDYARLVVAATPPAAPATPSDAFWLNPTEVA